MTTDLYDAAIAALRKLNTEQLRHLLHYDFRWIQRDSVSKDETSGDTSGKTGSPAAAGNAGE